MCREIIWDFVFIAAFGAEFVKRRVWRKTCSGGIVRGRTMTRTAGRHMGRLECLLLVTQVLDAFPLLLLSQCFVREFYFGADLFLV